MMNLHDILFVTTVWYLKGIRLRTKIALLIFIICCCITGVVFHFETETEGTVWTEGTVSISTTQIVPTWTSFTLRAGAPPVQHQIKEKTAPTFVPVLPKYTRYFPIREDFNGDLLIRNKSLGTYILNLYSFKPGWHVKGYIEFDPEVDTKPDVSYVATSTYIDAVFPPAKTKLTSLQINDVRYLGSYIDAFYDDPITIPIAQIFPDEAFVFLVEYFQIDIITHDSPFNFKVNRIYFVFISYVNSPQGTIAAHGCFRTGVFSPH